VDVAAAIGVLRRRWLPLALCVLAGVLGAGLLSSTSPKTYRASARLFVNIPAARDVQQALQGVQLSSQLIESYAKIAASRTVAERVSERLEGQFTAGEVRSKVSAASQADTLLLDVTATDGDPQSARDLANATGDVLAAFVGELEAGKDGSVEARVIDRAVTPTQPVSPRPKVDLTIGLLLGLFAGALVVAVLEAMDSSIADPAAATAALRAPVLASVPRHRHLGDEPFVALEGADSPGAESYRSLRTSVRFVDAGRTVRTLLVTSASAGEGKTTTASNLAIAFAQSGERVLVVDADLRRGRLAELFVKASTPGLADVIVRKVDLDAALVPWRERLSVLPPGTPPSNPSELLGSQAMADLLDVLGGQADVVVLDAPPILPVTDAVLLGALVDGVVVVTQWAKTTAIALEDARTALDNVGATVLGSVINGVRGGRARHYYRSRG
jgi:capsular exopolysaccharide synthesis family protein